jgi:hypothetical protein
MFVFLITALKQLELLDVATWIVLKFVFYKIYFATT